MSTLEWASHLKIHFHLEKKQFILPSPPILVITHMLRCLATNATAPWALKANGSVKAASSQ